MDRKTLFLILVILFSGALYLLIATSNGNFTFNMDVADDMVDVREMVSLQKIRLIGNIAGGVEGLFYGPGWYYLLTLPFIIFSGDPYGVTIMQIVLWAIGGYFLLKLVSKWGLGPILVAGSLWIGSHYILTAVRVALNPNPVIYLMPLFIFLLVKYIQSEKRIFAIGSFFLGGFFYNCEIAFGLFIPIIIILTILLLNRKLVKGRSFWIGSLFFFLWFIPQIVFDLRHNFLLSKAVITHLNGSLSDNINYNFLTKIEIVTKTYYTSLRSALMNNNVLVWLLIPTFLFFLFKIFKENQVKKGHLFITSLLIVIIPFVGQSISPADMMLWHTVGLIAVVPLLSSYLVYKLSNKESSYFFSLLITLLIVSLSADSLIKNFKSIEDMRADPAFYKNEIEAIDYVYQFAEGKNFKVYSYLPSVYDYPYQYLFWWHGLKKYGYVPKDYAYLPNMPEYIKNKDKLDTGSNPPDSGLIFLIKEPDPGNRHLWENSFSHLKLISSEKVGPLTIDTRRESEF